MEQQTTLLHKPKKELTIIRIFDAPREMVFKAWTHAGHLANWWGPAGFTNPVCQIDLRPGGAIRIDMKGPDGTVFPMSGTFREIIEPERLVFVSTAIADENGIPQLEALNTVTFENQNGMTKLTLHVTVTKASPAADQAISGMSGGWNQSQDRLAAYLGEYYLNQH
ncbi:SRPBCC family protein [Flavitalea flava]